MSRALRWARFATWSAIATNRCLNALRDRTRRPQEVPPRAEPPEPTRRAAPIWLEPSPDSLLEGLADPALAPEARYEAREAMGLAFLAALGLLQPRQRAALVLHDVLGFHTAEVAEMLDGSEASVKGALQGARATLDDRAAPGGRDRAPAPRSPRGVELVARFACAVESGDTAGVVALLAEDAWLTMPPEPGEYQGPAAIARVLHDREVRRGAPLQLVPTRANGQPASGCCRADARAPIARAHGLMVLTLTDERVSATTWFGGRSLVARFGLPPTLPVR